MTRSPFRTTEGLGSPLTDMETTVMRIVGREKSELAGIIKCEILSKDLREDVRRELEIQKNPALSTEEKPGPERRVGVSAV